MILSIISHLSIQYPILQEIHIFSLTKWSLLFRSTNSLLWGRLKIRCPEIKGPLRSTNIPLTNILSSIACKEKKRYRWEQSKAFGHPKRKERQDASVKKQDAWNYTASVSHLVKFVLKSVVAVIALMFHRIMKKLRV